MTRAERSPALLVAGTAVFFLLMPLQVAVTVPWLLSRWRMGPPLLGWPGFRVMGAVLIAAGVPVLLAAIVRFVRQGRGIPTPVLPARHLVVTGLYRHVRNPMYVAVVSVIVGQGLLFASQERLSPPIDTTPTLDREVRRRDRGYARQPSI